MHEDAQIQRLAPALLNLGLEGLKQSLTGLELLLPSRDRLGPLSQPGRRLAAAQMLLTR